MCTWLPGVRHACTRVQGAGTADRKVQTCRGAVLCHPAQYGAGVIGAVRTRMGKQVGDIVRLK